MIRKITTAEARRKKHLADCAGYEDCTCFGMSVSYADLYAMQQALAKYIRYVEAMEGITHLEQKPSSFTPGEWALLQAAAE